jgi:alcohol dehydrogenase (cytochrome c)
MRAGHWGALRANRPLTGKVKWEFRHSSPTWSGVLSTAGGLVFTGDAEGNFIALDAASGVVLWHFQMGAAVYTSPMAFALDGKKYIAIAAGSLIHAFRRLRRKLMRLKSPGPALTATVYRNN